MAFFGQDSRYPLQVATLGQPKLCFFVRLVIVRGFIGHAFYLPDAHDVLLSYFTTNKYYVNPKLYKSHVGQLKLVIPVPMVDLTSSKNQSLLR